jgi:hypothetical protein
MLRIYCDNTFYDFLDKGRFPHEEVEALEGLIASGRILGYFSPVNAAELVGQWETNREAAVRKFRTAQDLFSFENLLKQPADLLRDEVKAYGEGFASPPKTMTPSMRAVFADQLRSIARGDTSADAVARKVIADVKGMKDDALKQASDARDQVLTHMNWSARTEAERRSVTFEGFLAETEQYWAEPLADGAGPGIGDACRRRGIEGLLQRRPVRLCVSAMVSWVYSQTVPQGGGSQTRETDRGADFDLWHVLLASAADIFLTGDRALASNLRRVRVENFTVVTSLRELLDAASRPPSG